jgi:Pyruvate/2-oxoacid:ferredoxin oxidoreductase gamma subunit
MSDDPENGSAGCAQVGGQHAGEDFPLGVFRDGKLELPESAKVPPKTVAEALEVNESNGDMTPPLRHHTREITVNFAGFGGQGVLLIGQLLTEMGLREHMEVSWLPSYGPEMRSGSAHCYVTLSHERIGSPLISRPEVLVAMNEISLREFTGSVLPGGLIPYNAEKLPADFIVTHARAICISVSEIAGQIGTAKVANVVMLGSLLEETACLPTTPPSRCWKVLSRTQSCSNSTSVPFSAGRDYIDTTVEVRPVSRPDGYSG